MSFAAAMLACGFCRAEDDASRAEASTHAVQAVPMAVRQYPAGPTPAQVGACSVEEDSTPQAHTAIKKIRPMQSLAGTSGGRVAISGGGKGGRGGGGGGGGRGGASEGSSIGGGHAGGGGMQGGSGGMGGGGSSMGGGRGGGSGMRGGSGGSGGGSTGGGQSGDASGSFGGSTGRGGSMGRGNAGFSQIPFPQSAAKVGNGGGVLNYISPAAYADRALADEVRGLAAALTLAIDDFTTVSTGVTAPHKYGFRISYKYSAKVSFYVSRTDYPNGKSAAKDMKARLPMFEKAGKKALASGVRELSGGTFLYIIVYPE